MQYLLEITSASKYAKGTRLLVKIEKEAFLGTVVTTRLGKVYVDCDDGDQIKVSEDSKLILGEGIKRKVKKPIKLSEKASYLMSSKKTSTKIDKVEKPKRVVKKEELDPKEAAETFWRAYIKYGYNSKEANKIEEVHTKLGSADPKWADEYRKERHLAYDRLGIKIYQKSPSWKLKMENRQDSIKRSVQDNLTQKQYDKGIKVATTKAILESKSSTKDSIRSKITRGLNSVFDDNPESKKLKEDFVEILTNEVYRLQYVRNPVGYNIFTSVPSGRRFADSSIASDYLKEKIIPRS